MPPPPATDTKEELRGTLLHTTWRDPESGYSVIRLRPDDGVPIPGDGSLFEVMRVTAVGHAEALVEGQRLRLLGTWGKHATHGHQFTFEELEAGPPEETEGLIKYLASDLFPGIGATIAERIVERLGGDALRRIAEEPGALKGITGLREPIADGVRTAVVAELGSHRTRAFLRGVGLGPWQASSVLMKLGPDCEELVRADPYRIGREVTGLGFATADTVAAELGITGAHPLRLGAGIEDALRKGAGEGHTCLTKELLFDGVTRLLRLGYEAAPREELERALLAMEAQELVVVDREVLRKDTAPADEAPEERIYLPYLAASEQGLSEGLARLLDAADTKPLADAHKVEAAEAHNEIELHESQREALLGLLATPVGLLTGGPGVGKTTLVRLVVGLAQAAGFVVALASPTGRAAKRLAEATGHDASTVHRLLGYDPAKSGFLHDRDSPLPSDLVVVDEISMLDVTLAHHLIKAIGKRTRLILVGDPDQLPSVGAGNVLADLLASQVIPVWRLTHIYRQARESLIVTNAHRMLQGQGPVLPERGDLASDFYFFPAEDPERIRDLCVEVTTERIPARFELDWLRDVQVIAPMYKGESGVDSLNLALREALGAGGREVRRGDRIWRVADRVIHTRNDYERGVFNGDMGFIKEVREDGSLLVRFPDQEVHYESGAIGDLRPAFAITVHRSQGSEYPAVVLPLSTRHTVMLQRNLLYTAITRARRLVVLVGSRRALNQAIANVRPSLRRSALAERLTKRLSEAKDRPLFDAEDRS